MYGFWIICKANWWIRWAHQTYCSFWLNVQPFIKKTWFQSDLFVFLVDFLFVNLLIEGSCLVCVLSHLLASVCFPGVLSLKFYSPTLCGCFSLTDTQWGGLQLLANIILYNNLSLWSFKQWFCWTERCLTQTTSGLKFSWKESCRH